MYIAAFCSQQTWNECSRYVANTCAKSRGRGEGKTKESLRMRSISGVNNHESVIIKYKHWSHQMVYTYIPTYLTPWDIFFYSTAHFSFP